MEKQMTNLSMEMPEEWLSAEKNPLVENLLSLPLLYQKLPRILEPPMFFQAYTSWNVCR